MDLISLVTVIAFLVIAAEMSGRNRHAPVMLFGLLLLGVSLILRLLSGDGFFDTMIPLFRDIGLSLLITAVWLKLRKSRANPAPFFALGLMSLGLAGLGYAGAHFLGDHAETTTTDASFLLELGPDDQISEVAPLLDRYDARYERAFPTINLNTDADLAQVYLIYGDPASFDALMDALRADAENVDLAEHNSTVSLDPPLTDKTTTWTGARLYLENDPMVGSQWGLEAIHGHEAHALLRDLTPTHKARIAIVDTGVDAKHEDLGTIFRQSTGNTDANGHGTHCAGIAGAATNNGVGVASLNWEGRFVEVTGYHALGASGMGTIETIAQAIIDATNDGADVISMSLGDVAQKTPTVLTEAVDFALRNNVIVLASAGNSNEDAIDHFPSNIPGVMAVAAVDQDLAKAKFSNTNMSLTRPLAAPGVDILSTMPKQGYKKLSGTSMATPVVSGLVGVMRAINPNLTADEAYRILHETGTTVAASDQVGRVINAEAAILAVLATL
ncbi:MAG TPA: S8 family serine peptidase [Rhodothermales bacterium]|nr:S8 family serine peptidase [Rhodothermales bacterium]